MIRILIPLLATLACGPRVTMDVSHTPMTVGGENYHGRAEQAIADLNRQIGCEALVWKGTDDTDVRFSYGQPGPGNRCIATPGRVTCSHIHESAVAFVIIQHELGHHLGLPDDPPQNPQGQAWSNLMAVNAPTHVALARRSLSVPRLRTWHVKWLREQHCEGVL